MFNYIMKILELFSGTHSVGKVCEKLEFNEIVSLDRDLGGLGNHKHFKEDIHHFNYKQYDADYFDIVWASPVCCFWSQLKYSHIGRYSKKYERALTLEDINNEINEYGKPMVDKTLEIIEYFKGNKDLLWFIENPQSGRMKSYITTLPYYDVDYCMYSDFGYRKRTRIWTNKQNFKPKLCNKQCYGFKNNKHMMNIGGGTGGEASRKDKYRIPFKLVKELLT
jgi:hypothetical protein